MLPGKIFLIHWCINTQTHRATALGKLHRIGEQILDDLLHTLTVGVKMIGDIVAQLHRETEATAFGKVGEAATEMLAQLNHRNIINNDVHLAFFDLGNIQNVVDQ